MRQIELKRKRAELAAMRDLEQAKAKAAEARFRIEQAKLDAEEELVALSKRDSSVLGTETQHTAAFPRNDYENFKGLKALSSNNPFLQKNPQTWRSAEKPTTPANNSDSKLNAYLERQGRNEFIKLALQIGFDGTNIVFVFYENRVRRLMDESPYHEHILEVLRASCVGQPREMVNSFCAPMKNMSTAQRIEKALDRLRQRYGVSGGLTSEPKIIAIRHAAKIAFNSTSLKSFNHDLNTLEVYAYAHDEYHKLSGQLLIDTTNRLPNTLKRRYIDYLHRNGMSLNQPSFESLRELVEQEIKMSTSDYAQAFFKSEDKNKSREGVAGRGEFRVRQVAVGNSSSKHSDTASGRSSGAGSSAHPKREFKSGDKKPSVCFVCSTVADIISATVKGLPCFRRKKNARLSFRLEDVSIVCPVNTWSETVIVDPSAEVRAAVQDKACNCPSCLLCHGNRRGCEQGGE